jgi:hypothetical protein
LTDGDIHDLEETIEEISKISDEFVPLSIVIVGLGMDDFSNMVRLDGDELALKQGCRDLVQFVKYRDIESSSKPEDFDNNLTSALLEEIPRQMIEWDKQKN